MNTADALKLYLEDCKYRNLANKTVEGYRWAIGKLPEKLPETRDDLRSALVGARLGLSEESARDIWQRVRTMYNWLQDEQLVDPNPAARLQSPRVHETFPRTLTHSELRAIMQAARNRQETALATVALDTGMRLGEIASMKWPNISKRSITVHGKTGPRTVPLSSQAAASIVGLGRGEAIWTTRSGAPMGKTGIQQSIRHLLTRAGIHPPKAGPHVFRHTFGRMYIMAGGDVFSLQRIMGHRSLESTMIYVRMNAEDLIDQHSRFSPVATMRFMEDYASEGVQMRLKESE